MAVAESRRDVEQSSEAPKGPNGDHPTELDIRIAALCSEYELSIAAQARRSATLAAELASAQARISVLEATAKALAEAQSAVERSPEAPQGPNGDMVGP